MAITYRKFKSGKIAASTGVTALLRESWGRLTELDFLINCHHTGDWGYSTREEAYANDLCLKNDEPVMSKFLLGGHEIRITTSGDRSVTTTYLEYEECLVEKR